MNNFYLLTFELIRPRLNNILCNVYHIYIRNVKNVNSAQIERFS